VGACGVGISKADWETDLVSAKLEGMSTVMAPPKRGVFVNDIFAGSGYELGFCREVLGLMLLMWHVVRGLYVCVEKFW
jgi:hypothetical protein